MVNVFIIDDNIYEANKIMTHINRISDDIRVIKLSTDINDAIRTLNNDEKIDIILLNLKMPLRNIALNLDKIMPKKRQKYKKSLIIKLKDKNYVEKKYIINEMVYTILSQQTKIWELCNTINKIIFEKNYFEKRKILKLNIQNELHYLRYNFSHKGTQYLEDIIYIVYTKYSNVIVNMNKDIYPIIARKYNKKIGSIKSNVIRATEAMYYNCEENTIKEYFNNYDIQKPNIKTVINTIILKIENKSLYIKR